VLRLVANDRAIGEVVNIGSEQEVTIEGLAQVGKARTGSDSSITYVPYDKAYEPGFEDMQRRVPALEKLESLTDFRPATQLPEIVDRVTADFQKRAERDHAMSVDRVPVAGAHGVSAGQAIP